MDGSWAHGARDSSRHHLDHDPREQSNVLSTACTWPPSATTECSQLPDDYRRQLTAEERDPHHRYHVCDLESLSDREDLMNCSSLGFIIQNLIPFVL
jgi:hypothetical protein